VCAALDQFNEFVYLPVQNRGVVMKLRFRGGGAILRHDCSATWPGLVVRVTAMGDSLVEIYLVSVDHESYGGKGPVVGPRERGLDWMNRGLMPK
jgi:hypothetical protein